MSKDLDLKNKIDNLKIKEAAEIIKNGGIVVFPTETVYGIGANGLNANAVDKIFIAKKRKKNNPLILLISSKEMLDQIVEDINEVESKLIEAFWPGPLTIVLKRKSCVPDIVTAGLDTVGVRLTSGKIARKLVEEVGFPIVAPSANISGKPSAIRVEDIFEDLNAQVDCIIDGGKSELGLESTIVRVIDGITNILRPGQITPEQIKQVVGVVQIEPNEKVLLPGEKYNHYTPNSKCILVYSENNEKMVEKIKNLIQNYNNVTIVSCSENVEKYKEITNSIINIGSAKDLNEISKNIFSALHEVDKIMPDLVIIEGVRQEGVGLAIMNRLIKACGNNYIKI